MSESQRRRRRRVCGYISHRLGLDYDETENYTFSKRDLYDIIKWHSEGDQPPLSPDYYPRHKMEAKLVEELGFDRRSESPNFTMAELDTIKTIIDARLDSAETSSSDEWEAVFKTARELEGIGREDSSDANE